MNYIDDTIAAISTPVGRGGIGIVRISGTGSLRIADNIFRHKKKLRPSEAGSYSMLYGNIVDPDGYDEIDEVLVSVMRAPHSYTREDVVEINCHGGMVSTRKILEIILGHGARLAEPGEFTKRAFLNGRINLEQAEAVLDLISAKTEESMKIALDQLKGGLSEKLDEVKNILMEICALSEAYIDFPEDDIEIRADNNIESRLTELKCEIEQLSATFREARFFREGLSVAIVGRPNVGKSSLLNALLKKDRAIVTEIPGTTRDLIEEFININGLPVRLMDTAGIRDSDETVEKEGIRRSLYAMDNADFIIAMFDGSEALQQDDLELMEKIKNKNAVIAVNKSDLPAKISIENIRASSKQYLNISAVTGDGLKDLKSIIFNSNLKNWEEEREGIIVTNLRHKIALDRASSSLGKALRLLSDNQPLEIFLIQLRDSLDSIGEITGTVTSEDILNKIFSDFCIGK
ncbi:MAG: tRNA uridine-5-carboxymethylaminomethyl(34) synthesis GTPase MnmE [Nitrospirota bacterium]